MIATKKTSTLQQLTQRIAPTLLEVTGIPTPVQVDGVAQKPIEGVSLAYTCDKDAGGFDASSRHHLQYFEMLGIYGLYNDGWILSAKPIRAPWQLTGAAVDGKVVATERLEVTLPMTKPLDTVFNIGDAAGTPVDDGDYKIPFPFTGKIDKLTVKLGENK